jgi:mannose-6-phosphate isomerase class I
MPREVLASPPGRYNIYPAYPLEAGKIELGYPSLVQSIIDQGKKVIILEGFPGVIWGQVQQQLSAAFSSYNIRVAWQAVDKALLPAADIDQLVAPFLGGDDPLFGFRFSGGLRDFFDQEALANIELNPQADINIIYGTGAALAGWKGYQIYFDVPKNEIQFRVRAKSVKNIGVVDPLPPKQAYKRSYFVDWVVANRHKAELLPNIDLVVDEQDPEHPSWMAGNALREALRKMAHTCFRVRPWFEPGPWGGQWIMAHIPQLPQDVPNYAWSFELISPENGLVFVSGNRLLEVSFDTLMFQEHAAVLGQCAPNFRYEFPIRFDFLDTFDGGNLSIQCHPRPEYIRQHFGERFTQDETYYILDAAPGARIYLGFQDGANPQEFKEKLLESARTNTAVNVETYVKSLPAKKHDLFLIPNGTVHGSGKDNLVLEISATPYIFTFKMYDWLRLDLDGKPRTLNIERAFENLHLDRKGQRIEQEFLSRQTVIAEGEDWRLVHCPTHKNQFFDVQRYEFRGTVQCHTGGAQVGSCHVLSLVEGTTIWVEIEDGFIQPLNYAETIIIPAAAGAYRLISPNDEWVKVVKAFVKPASQWLPGVVPEGDQFPSS